MTQGVATSERPAGVLETATLAGGCFWCLEPVFAELVGVKHVVPGYAGGATPNPTYGDVCSGATGHSEVVQVTFDPQRISFPRLLEVFFSIHDPTTLNRQGADTGTQYRSAVFYHSEEQRRDAKEVVDRFEQEGVWEDPIVTEVAPFTAFYPAEEYHREYFQKNPNQGYCRVVIAPKLAKLRGRFGALLKSAKH